VITIDQATGNAVILRPSHITPGVGWRLVRAWQRAVPEHGTVLQDLIGYAATGQALIEAGVDKVAFTGSVRSGKAGDGVIAVISTANRDGAAFGGPERLDLARGARNHISFGHGVHQCIGRNPARAELEIALGAVFRRLPGLRPAIPADELPVRRRPAASRASGSFPSPGDQSGDQIREDHEVTRITAAAERCLGAERSPTRWPAAAPPCSPRRSGTTTQRCTTGALSTAWTRSDSLPRGAARSAGPTHIDSAFSPL